MLLLRCWALYDKKRVIWVLCGGLIGAVVSGVVIVKFLLDRTMFLDNPFPTVFSGCVVMVPDYVWILYIVPLIYESSLFFLTIWRIYGLSKDFGATPLMQTLARNGMTYFATLVGIMILACIGGTIPPVKIAANGSGVLSAMSSVVCSRMIFSLYRISDKELRERQVSSRSRDDPDEGIIPHFAIPLQSLASTTVSCNISRLEQV
ncbi:F-box-like domain protein [Rhizoctonia solani]|uniref:F-box-like domain protein n=1 Tax=Rhizoctonia solani TaxID=456999 RepID=A0A8H8T238_9AGAM|nr:F-box-like domain protein [Rhizoctonia solani]QRW26474.1 F-box-like domain protein [Rhizoctonia solani]